MTLDFIEVDGYFCSEFCVGNHFNLHIERTSGGEMEIYEKTFLEGEYTVIDHEQDLTSDVVDCDFSAIVYPKYIKVMSSTKPDVAELTIAK